MAKQIVKLEKAEIRKVMEIERGGFFSFWLAVCPDGKWKIHITHAFLRGPWPHDALVIGIPCLTDYKDKQVDFLLEAFLNACNGEGKELNTPNPWGIWYHGGSGKSEKIEPPAKFEWGESFKTISVLFEA